MGDVFFTKDHEWIQKTSDGKFRLGVTDYAIEQLGDIVHLEAPDVGASFSAGDAFGTIESTKTVSDVYLPVDAKITQVHTAVVEEPQKIADQKRPENWLVEFSSEASLPEGLMGETEYQSFIES